MDKNYYTPSIEEFHVGFEYEFKGCGDSEWTKSIIKDGTQIDDIHRSYKEERIYDLRVKFLDQEDIEELGWKFLTNKAGCEFRGLSWLEKEYADKRTGKTEDMNLLHNPKHNWVLISQEYDNNTRFAGYIKNKSELKRLMVQLGIQP